MASGDPRRQPSGEGRREPSPARRENEDDEVRIVPVEAGDEDSNDGAETREDRSGDEVDLSELLLKEEREREALEDKFLRLRAEFDNYRKRQAREFHRLCSAGKRDLIEELLAVLDNVRRAEQLSEEGHSSEEILSGMFQTAGMLGDILSREGLQRLSIQTGEHFDPNVHEAMIAEEVEDVDHDVVLEVFQDGYLLEQELLRPARVKVGKPIPADKGPQDEEEKQQQA